MPNGNERAEIGGGVSTSLQVEIHYKDVALNNSTFTKQADSLVADFLALNIDVKRNYVPITNLNEVLTELVHSVCLCSINAGDNEILTVSEAVLRNDAKYIAYQLYETDSCLDEFSVDNESEDETVVGSRQWMLPHANFHLLWNSLIYEKPIKEDLLRYVFAMVKLAHKGVSSDIVTSNRLIMLFGPPGTGKTTLCRALAQRLSIHLKPIFKKSVLVEVNSHSLFSKYFSESGKLVMRLMERVEGLLADSQCLVLLMIDEVESLTMARQKSMASSEPSDALRVVNALLTQIDQLRKYPNLVLLATSNLTKAIDDAFVDRADIRMYVGPPAPNAAYSILLSTINELQNKNVVEAGIKLCSTVDLIENSTAEQKRLSSVLNEVAQLCSGKSGRALRRLPTLAYARGFQYEGVNGIPLEQFLECMRTAASNDQVTSIHTMMYPNLVLLATSNLTKAIDDAFVDRADIRMYVGPPAPNAAYSILLSTINELQNKNVVEAGIKLCSTVDLIENSTAEQRRLSSVLNEVAQLCSGKSGRALRRLPTLAYARGFQYEGVNGIPLEQFLECMRTAASNDQGLED